MRLDAAPDGREESAMKRPVFVTIAALTLGAIPAPALAQQVVGVVSAIKNHVRLRKPRAPMLPAALRQRVAIGEEVHTGARSQLQMLLLDKSIFTVGANAQLTVDHFVYDPNRGTRSMGATVARGAFRFMSGKRTSGSSTIKTPVATIGVRGTLVDGVVGQAAALIAAGEPAGRGVQSDPATASLIVLRGPGPATRGNVSPGAIDVTSGGQTVNADRPMLAIYVPGPDRRPIGPFVISDAGLMKLQALLFPALAEQWGWQPPVDPDAVPPRPGVWTPAESAPPRRERSPFYPRPGDGPANDGPPPGVNPQFPLDSLPSLPPPPRRPQEPAPERTPQAQPDPVDRPASPPPAQDQPPPKRADYSESNDPGPPPPQR
jgi:hypothetical protein